MYSTILFASWLQHHSIYFWQWVEDSFLAPLLHLLGLSFTMSALRFLNYGQPFLFWFFLVNLRKSRWPCWGLRMKHLKGKTCAVSYCIPLLLWLTWSLHFCFYIRDASEDRISNRGNMTLSAQYQQIFITIRIHKYYYSKCHRDLTGACCGILYGSAFHHFNKYLRSWTVLKTKHLFCFTVLEVSVYD